MNVLPKNSHVVVELCKKSPAAVSQLMAVDVILVHGLFHVVADQHAERARAVTLLVSLQLIPSDEGKLLLAVATHQQLPETEPVMISIFFFQNKVSCQIANIRCINHDWSLLIPSDSLMCIFMLKPEHQIAARLYG